MFIDGRKIANNLLSILKKERKAIKKRVGLSVFLVGSAPEQLSFVKIKSAMAKALKIDFKLIHLTKTPNFIDFANLLKKEVMNPNVTGIIIQQPLPAQLSTDSIYDYIPLLKEIEGHKRKTDFIFPLGLAVMTLIKFIYYGKRKQDIVFVNMKKDRVLFKNILKSKKIVIVGRGMTGGMPIGKTLGSLNINYISTNSTTVDPESYFKTADLIITATGKKVIEPEMLKPGVVLINTGVRKENGKLKGDYEESEIKDIASHYTPTPGGSGPIDVVYLYKNLIDAARMQK
ncbi:MAG: bifunctional 5,10-methylenetetrahydrofolate dehydrogenase/5,10-methenyltetrahydrofolate cyclohydrolase [Candidatus Roizmanbacteria bacterium]|nr:bifunctional 5,10-methylenetetrahydrofolate dehydrogenase/5,10-methenyltetrahydrofolate cyclohydrolase [Candidatus Roizmanbacteria bacterium]MCR4312977.1 bifunctional 5,10-methylenetetrahydrofolate dehydrogenase/5,10-methenyltetrahydrofolate cyclohydrolase [Candidatus Roizmanbacteria bacterium]